MTSILWWSSGIITGLVCIWVGYQILVVANEYLSYTYNSTTISRAWMARAGLVLTFIGPAICLYSGWWMAVLLTGIYVAYKTGRLLKTGLGWLVSSFFDYFWTIRASILAARP